LIIDVILALGLVVNLTLLVATTKVQVQKGTDGKTSWTFGKKEADLLEKVLTRACEQIECWLAEGS